MKLWLCLQANKCESLGNLSVLVSVLGPSSHGTTYRSIMGGIGKSCLCRRFLHDSADDNCNESLLALNEHEKQAIATQATEPFLYWGSRTIEFDNPCKQVEVRFEIVEHTTFYIEETLRSVRKLMSAKDMANKVSVIVPDISTKTKIYCAGGSCW